MSTLASVVLTDVLARVRDPNATMNSSLTPPTTAEGQAFVFAQISSAQLFINLAERLVTKTVTFAPTANTVLYRLATIIPDCVTVLAVRVPAVTELDGPCDWRGFARNSFTWLSDVGTQYLAWAQIGKDVLALVPAFAATPPAVSIRYLPTLTAITLGTTPMTVPDDSVEHVTRLAELVCRIKTRQLDGFEDRIKMLADSLELSLQATPKDATAL